MPYAFHRSNPATEGDVCPFFVQEGACRASFSGLTIDPTRATHYCTVEDHDLCPIFLAKVLRSTLLTYCDSHHREFIHK